MDDSVGEFDIYNIYDDCGDDTMSYKEMTRQLSNKTVVISGL